MRAMALTAALGLAVAVAATSAAAACGPMTVQSVPGTREVHFVDDDASGAASLGDMRYGVIALQDKDANPVSAEYWLSTLKAVDARGEPTSYEEVQVFVFHDGALFTASGAELASAFGKTETTIVSSGAKRRVVGGTGAYAGARGTMDMTVDGLDFKFRFHLTCK